MAATTFHQFSQLPDELKIQIMTLATELSDKIPRRGLMSKIFDGTMSYIPNGQTYNFERLLLKSFLHMTNICGYQDRNALLATSHLFRDITLRKWKEDIDAIEFLVNGFYPYKKCRGDLSTLLGDRKSVV